MTADEIIDQVKDLPVVSETARKLAMQLNQPDLHRDDLVETVRCDGVLTAKLLRACNAASFGVREPVASVDQALLLLGDNAIFRMVCAIGFGTALGTLNSYDAEGNDLWTHSLSVAIGSEYLTDVEGYGNFIPSAAFTAGLLHDIGKTVINKMLTAKARSGIWEKICIEQLPPIAAEKAVLGTSHCEVGASLLRRWRLPDLVIEAVANHHAPAVKPGVGLSAVVFMADRAVLNASVSPSVEQKVLAEANKTSAAILGLDIAKVERMVSGIQSAMDILPQFKAAA
ncbi:MAG TPA: HDOD domain-containing protein [Verrucomicrobiae bacterium]|jgi:putative nucleotidyltransferase with HDIG domain